MGSKDIDPDKKPLLELHQIVTDNIQSDINIYKPQEKEAVIPLIRLNQHPSILEMGRQETPEVLIPGPNQCPHNKMIKKTLFLGQVNKENGLGGQTESSYTSS